MLTRLSSGKGKVCKEGLVGPAPIQRIIVSCLSWGLEPFRSYPVYRCLLCYSVPFDPIFGSGGWMDELGGWSQNHVGTLSTFAMAPFPLRGTSDQERGGSSGQSTAVTVG